MLRNYVALALCFISALIVIPHVAVGQDSGVIQDNFRSGHGGDSWQGGAGFERLDGSYMFSRVCPGIMGYALYDQPMTRRPVSVKSGRYRVIVRFFSARAYSLSAERQSIDLGMRLSLVGAKSFSVKPAELTGYPGGCKIYQVDDVVHVREGGDLTLALRYNNPDQRIGGKVIRITEVLLFALDRMPAPLPPRELVEVPNSGRACQTVKYAWGCASSQRVADRGTAERRCGGADQRDCCLAALTHRRDYCAALGGVERFTCACRTFVSVEKERPTRRPRQRRDNSDLTDQVAEDARSLLDDARRLATLKRDALDSRTNPQLAETFEGLYEDIMGRYRNVVDAVNTEKQKNYARQRRSERLLQSAEQSSGLPGAAAKADELRAEIRTLQQQRELLQLSFEKAQAAYRMALE